MVFNLIMGENISSISRMGVKIYEYNSETDPPRLECCNSRSNIAMLNILKDLSAPSLARSVKANLYAFFHILGRSSKSEFYTHPKLVRWHTPIPHPWFQGILSAESAELDDDQLVRDMVSYFKSCGVTSFTWWLEPNLKPDSWSSHLSAHGFRYDKSTPGMAVHLAALPGSVPQPEKLVIRVVDDLEALEVWVRSFMLGYGLPEAWSIDFFELLASLGLDLPIRHYLAYLDGEPVANSTLLLGAGVAGIYNVATIPEARGQGIGAALTLFPLQQAAELGYHAGILQSSEMGFSVYRRLGFQHLCQMDHFFWKSDVDS